MLRKLFLVTGAILLAGGPAAAQQTTSSATPQPSPAVQQVAEATVPAQPASVPARPRAKSKKVEYTGPNTIIELPPTPLLDEQGMQMLDPDGKPMWNPPVKQQRDKHGHPLFDVNGKPVFQTASELGYDDHGKKLHAKKVKPPKMIPASVCRGTMTVDGMTGKAALNYDIPDLKYIYLYAPGIGVAVVSNEPFPGATEQKDAFNNNTLTVNIGEHTMQVASEKRILGKKGEPGYVLLDRSFTLPSRFPVMGYGTLRKAPYVWPAAKPNSREADIADFAPPPPSDLLPVQMLQPCPAGQMRRPAPPVLPGQTAPPQPCVPIKSAVPAKPASQPAPVVQAASAVQTQPSPTELSKD